MSSISIGTAGMTRASHQLQTSADRIARFGTGLGDVDLGAEMTNILVAKADFKASVKVVETARDMSKALFDILA
ncbi:MAG: hypothetical protein ABS75_17670 [Pelagibacterium sp. SCN 63-23]|nr:MAG: hypothetical protein ABS75_17670 [Pelagibacterium sp. SCN 63-23]